MTKLNANATTFVPRAKTPTIKRSVRYIGAAEDYDRIKSLFEYMIWGQDVHTVFITNGWHQGFEGGRNVWYCGYCANEDNEIYKQHFYAPG